MIGRLVFIAWPVGILAAPQIVRSIGIGWTIVALVVWPCAALLAESELP